MSETPEPENRWVSPVCPHGKNTVYGPCPQCFLDHQRYRETRQLTDALRQVADILERTAQTLDKITACFANQPATHPVTGPVDRACTCSVPQGGTSFCYVCKAPAREDQLIRFTE